MAQYNREQHDREYFSQRQGWREPVSDRRRGPFSGIGPQGYQRSDERIFEDVCERLKWHGQIDVRNIQVEVQNGEVTLSGTVDGRRTRQLAEHILYDVFGVKDLHNRLHIQAQQRQREIGQPGGGRGRVDQVGQTGIYPASGRLPETDAEVHGMASWGQGERGAAGYEDSGSSELHIPEEEEGRRERKQRD